MEPAQSIKSMNTRTRKKGSSTYMIGDTLNARSTETTLPYEQGSKSHLHTLDTVEVVLKLEKVLLPVYIPTADALSKSL